MALSKAKVKKYYDRFGIKQDSQGFYEDPPVERLIEQGDFGNARRVFELGCGTGRLAARLLADHLSADASYSGVDVSDTMIALASQRLERFGKRVSLSLSTGGTEIPRLNHSLDRVVSAYVLDLLPEEEIEELFEEAHRVLDLGGLLCCVSLTRGTGVGSRLVSALWSAVYRVAPSLVGGCRPISLAPRLDLRRWDIVYHEILTPFAVPSEVLVARLKV
ncbi:MAG TPA: class I SAM-dependent methyltransferase [Spirochaetia bacterium]|nr:class I SAM-dependent methyltransferase [Spirochaetia bacterium]